jgi:hypothetical protein
MLTKGSKQINRLARAASALGLALVLTGVVTSGANAANPGQPLFAGINPRTDGTTVIYQSITPPNDSDVDAATVADRMQFPIAIGDSQALFPDIDAGLAVWSESTANGDLDIMGRQNGASSSFLIAGGANNQVLPAISGSHVSYVSAPREVGPGSAQTLQVIDLNGSGAQKLDSVMVGGGSGGFLRPAINGERIAWVRMEQIGDHLIHWQLKTQRLGESSATIIAEEDLDIGGPLGALSQPAYDLVGNTLVYSADLNLTAVDLVTGHATTLNSIQSADYKPAQNPTTDGRYLFWQDYRATGSVWDLVDGLQHGTLRSDIMGYDLVTGTEFAVAVDDGYNTAPYVRNGVLAFEHRATQSDATTVFTVSVSQIVPVDDSIYFPETGHTLSGRFAHYWEINGGLAVFGYPLTDELSENGMTVQYFERQRFEYHPELAGTEYVIQLGLTGVEDAQRRGIANSAPFQPLPAGAQSDGYTEFFPETGHRLGGGFKAYWHAHGLGLGDPGTSDRESLALFGYPISEEFTDPATGLTVQYFERARFEYHPNNPEPYKILLGRLTADAR